MSNFAYTVAIRLTLANLASQGVKLLAKDLLAAHGAATNLQTKLSALKMIGIGFGMEKAGQGILGFMGKAIDASKDYTHQLALMNAAGFTQRELAQSTAAAWATSSKVITTTAADNLVAIRELRSAFGKGEGMEHAYAVLPQVQRVSAILESLTGKKQERVGFDMVKAIELGTKGAITVDAMMRQSEAMTKALVQFGGTLTVSDFHQAIKQSRAMAPYLSEDFKFKYLPTLIQEMKTGPSGGAGSAGTALASLGQVVVGQMIPKALITNWEQVGLLSRDKVVHDPHNRTMDKLLPGAIAGANEFASNPYLWAQKYLAPAVAMGMRLNPALDQYGSILSLTHNRVAAFAMQTLINKGPQFERDKKLIEEGPTSYASYQQLLKRDPQMAQTAMHSQYQNLLAIIGYQILPKMIPFMIKFADGLNMISTWMAAHPRLTEGLVIGLGSLGIALDIAGKALMAAGIIKFLGIGPIISSVLGAMGVGLLAVLPELIAIGAIAFVIYRNWNKILPELKKIWNVVTAVWKVGSDAVMGMAKSVWNICGPTLTKVFDALYNFLSNLGSVALNAIPGYAAGKAVLGLAEHVIDVSQDWANRVNGNGQKAGNVYLDKHLVGKYIAPSVTKHQTAAASRPNSSGNAFNGAMSPMHANFVGR
jgi:hypothetical protein